MGVLGSVEQVLALLTGRGALRGGALGCAFDEQTQLPSAHRRACHVAMLRAQKQGEAVRARRRAQQVQPLSGLVCVRYGDANEAFDVVNRHDERGYALELQAVRAPEPQQPRGVALRRSATPGVGPAPPSPAACAQMEEQFRLSDDFVGRLSCVLVEEDAGQNFEARAWMARKRVYGRDGPARAVDASGGFSRLKPNSQYRLEVSGTRRESHTPSDGAWQRGPTLPEQDTCAIVEDRASCSCLWGSPCASEYNCKDWAGRFEVARRNGWKG